MRRASGRSFPILFITVACGACSGFHSLVASGTSSKQIDKESHARTVGYGAMLVEGLVAVIALVTVMMVASSDSLRGQQPTVMYANGMSRFVGVLGIPGKIGFSFGSARAVHVHSHDARHGHAAGPVHFRGVLPAPRRVVAVSRDGGHVGVAAGVCAGGTQDAQGNPLPAWKAIWPVFGATNQLLAGLTLLVLAVWVRKLGKPIGFLILPLVFMTTATLYALVLLVGQYRLSLIGVIAIVLLLLAILLIIESARTLKYPVR